MMFQSNAVLLALSCLCCLTTTTTTTTTNAFTLSARSLPARSHHPAPSSTWHLAMSEEGGSEDNINTEEAAAAAQDTAADTTGNDILNSPAFLKRKLEVLKSDIEKTEADLEAALEKAEVAKEEWGPQLEDLQREYENIRERMSSQNETGDAQAIVKVVQAVLELLDNFDRAYGVIKPETDADRAIEEDYKAAYQSILETFEKLGVTEVGTVGQEFDYELHQAVMQMPGTEYDEGIVCQEFQKGFIMEETLIRPAMVAVAV